MRLDMKWKTILFDGSEIEYEQEIEVNGRKKPASIDDIDKSKISQLITFDDNGKVIHNLFFKEGDGKKAVWRRTSGITASGDHKQLYCLSGYTMIGKDGKEILLLDRVLPDGKIESAEGESIELHDNETIKNIINDKQEMSWQQPLSNIQIMQ